MNLHNEPEIRNIRKKIIALFVMKEAFSDSELMGELIDLNKLIKYYKWFLWHQVKCLIGEKLSESWWRC